MTERNSRKYILIVGVLLVAGVFLSFFLGKFSLGPKEVMGILTSPITGGETFWTSQQEQVFWAIRLPRILLACLVGCALASAGCVYQAVFENPMAAPDFLGASSGAAFGAALAIIMGGSGVKITAMAFAFSMATILLVYAVGSRAPGNKTVGLVLAGLMISSIAQAGTSFIKLVADQTNELPAITYWLMGSLSSTKTEDLLFAAVVVLLGILPIFGMRWHINVLTIGEQEAETMGVSVGRTRIIALVAATLITAAVVSVSGMIGWVGLVIPHFCRKFTGSNFRWLLPASMLTGALFLLLVDDVSRNLFAVEIPIGILTAMIGAPFFLYLIFKGGRK